MNSQLNKMPNLKMLLDITPSVSLPAVSFLATGSQVISLLAGIMGLVYTGMRMYSWIEERKKAKKN